MVLVNNSSARSAELVPSDTALGPVRGAAHEPVGSNGHRLPEERLEIECPATSSDLHASFSDLQKPLPQLL